MATVGIQVTCMEWTVCVNRSRQNVEEVVAVNKQKVVDIVPLRSFQRREDELDKSDKQRDE